VFEKKVSRKMVEEEWFNAKQGSQVKNYAINIFAASHSK
jgi:hypothetical protein